MEKHIATILSLLLFSAIGYSAIWESGDGGAAFAADISVKKCKEANVAEVHICNGNVVEVVSSTPGEGSTFFKPDGRIVYCPNISATEMGAECVQLFHPNFCDPKSVCKPPAKNETGTIPTTTQGNKTKKTTGVGIPDIEPNMSVPERQTPPESEGGIKQEVFIFAVIIVGMIAVALINYIYFKTKGT